MNTKLLLLAAVACVAPFALNSCDPYYGAPYSPGYHGGGTYLSKLPHGYRTVHVSGSPYFYHNNIWYLRKNGRFYRTSRPIGYKGHLGKPYKPGFAKLPSGYKSYTHKGVRYYNHGGKWYRYGNGKYYTVSRPSGLRINSPRPSNPSTRASGFFRPDTRVSPSRTSTPTLRNSSSRVRNNPSRVSQNTSRARSSFLSRKKAEAEARARAERAKAEELKKKKKIFRSGQR